MKTLRLLLAAALVLASGVAAGQGLGYYGPWGYGPYGWGSPHGWGYPYGVPGSTAAGDPADVLLLSPDPGDGPFGFAGGDPQRPQPAPWSPAGHPAGQQ
jgi:hypothetical protein